MNNKNKKQPKSIAVSPPSGPSLLSPKLSAEDPASANIYTPLLVPDRLDETPINGAWKVMHTLPELLQHGTVHLNHKIDLHVWIDKRKGEDQVRELESLTESLYKHYRAIQAACT